MAWGGGGFGHGGGFGPPPGQRPGQAAPGLPFAGIPQEMLPGVEKLLRQRPRGRLDA